MMRSSSGIDFSEFSTTMMRREGQHVVVEDHQARRGRSSPPGGGVVVTLPLPHLFPNENSVPKVTEGELRNLLLIKRRRSRDQARVEEEEEEEEGSSTGKRIRHEEEDVNVTTATKGEPTKKVKKPAREKGEVGTISNDRGRRSTHEEEKEEDVKKPLLSLLLLLLGSSRTSAIASSSSSSSSSSTTAQHMLRSLSIITKFENTQLLLFTSILDPSLLPQYETVTSIPLDATTLVTHILSNRALMMAEIVDPSSSSAAGASSDGGGALLSVVGRSSSSRRPSLSHHILLDKDVLHMILNCMMYNKEGSTYYNEAIRVLRQLLLWTSSSSLEEEGGGGDDEAGSNLLLEAINTFAPVSVSTSTPSAPAAADMMGFPSRISHDDSELVGGAGKGGGPKLFPTFCSSGGVGKEEESLKTEKMMKVTELLSDAVKIRCVCEAVRVADRNGVAAAFPRLRQFLNETLLNRITMSCSSSSCGGSGYTTITGSNNNRPPQQEPQSISVAHLLNVVDLAIGLNVAQTSSATEVSRLFQIRDAVREVVENELKPYCRQQTTTTADEEDQEEEELFQALVVHRYDRSIVTATRAQHQRQHREQQHSGDPQEKATSATLNRLQKVVQRLMELDTNRTFTYPFLSQEYLSRVSKPVDLTTIACRISTGYYLLLEDCRQLDHPQKRKTVVQHFISDIEQVVENCIAYNGPASILSQEVCRLREQLGAIMKEEGLYLCGE